MSAPPEPRRVLLTAADSERQALRGLFAAPALAAWEVVEADDFPRARFALQTQPCDVVLVDGGLLRPDMGEGLAWLAEQSTAPLLLLTGPAPAPLVEGLRQGALGWLPPDLAFSHPAVLDALLRQLARVSDQRRRTATLAGELSAAPRRVDRLAELLWEAASGHGPARWFAQRYMVERLDEELARTRRHGGPLSVVLGEVQFAGRHRDAPEQGHVAAWAASQVALSKRRGDVAGQYGLHGFMLLLPRAAEPEVAGACRRLRTVLEQPATAPGPIPPLRAYFGVASVAPGATTVPGLLRRAEEQLEQAKEANAQP
jgi:diguanylate cyclase (GGDEF)-like protein